MFGFLLSLTAFIRDKRIKYKAKKEEARQRLQEIKNRLRDSRNKEIEGKVQKKPKLVDRLISMILYVVSLLVAFIEMMVVFIMLFKWILIGGIVVITALIIISFYSFIVSLLTEQGLIGKFDKPETGDACYRPSGGTLAWTIEELNAKGAVLTEYQKNLYRMGILAREALTGYGSGKEFMPSSKDMYTKILFQLGIQSTEGSMAFYYKEAEKDILKYPTKTRADYSGDRYRFMGLDHTSNFNTYIRSNYFTSTEVNNVKKKYSPSIQPSYDSQYAPYAMLMSVGHMDSKLKIAQTKAKFDGKTAKDRIDAYAKAYGIEANKQEFENIVYLLLAQAQYHGAVKDEYNGYISFWAALFALSSDNDANRSFFNYEIRTLPGKGTSYAESSPNRQNYIGSYEKPSEARLNSSYSSMKFNSSKAPSWGIYLNGKLINEPLWKFVGENTHNKEAFKVAWSTFKSVANSSGGKRDRVLNFHYGLNSLWQGARIERDLSSLMGIAGQTQQDIECNTDSPSGSYKGVAGKSQVIINGKPLKEYMEEYYKKAPSYKVAYLKGLEKHWGRSSYLEDPNNPARKGGYVDKIHGVPFFGQASQYNESFGKYPYVPGGNTYYVSACMIYSYAYAASSQLGILVTPPEMGSMLHANNGFVGNAVKTQVASNVLNQLGLKTKNLKTLGGIDETLNKRGVIVIRVDNFGCKKPGVGNCFTDSHHFMVITGKENKDGKTMYHIYTSSYHTQSMMLFTKEQLQQRFAYRANNPALHVWKE